MKTAVVSDLHLGCRSHTWLLSQAEPREQLTQALADADRLLLLGDPVELRESPRAARLVRLGDLVELRESPLADVLDAATPALEAIGRAMAGSEVVIVPGNHD